MENGLVDADPSNELNALVSSEALTEICNHGQSR
jgi:hypothetical protein